MRRSAKPSQLRLAQGVPVVVAAGVALLLSSTAARAQAVVETLEVEVTASVPGRCGFVGSAPTTPTQDIESAGQVAVALLMDCNTPFAVGVSAAHGALLNRTYSDDLSGFAFRKAYGVRLEIDTDAGAVMGARCEATQLLPGGSCAYQGDVSGHGLSSGEGIAIDREMRVIIDWSDQSTRPARLASGAYQDTLRVVIGARI